MPSAAERLALWGGSVQPRKKRVLRRQRRQVRWSDDWTAQYSHDHMAKQKAPIIRSATALSKGDSATSLRRLKMAVLMDFWGFRCLSELAYARHWRCRMRKAFPSRSTVGLGRLLKQKDADKAEMVSLTVLH